MLGMEPGIRSSNVPGRDVGYMPQVNSNIAIDIYNVFSSLKFLHVFNISVSYSYIAI